MYRYIYDLKRVERFPFDKYGLKHLVITSKTWVVFGGEYRKEKMKKLVSRILEITEKKQLESLNTVEPLFLRPFPLA